MHQKPANLQKIILPESGIDDQLHAAGRVRRTGDLHEGALASIIVLQVHQS